MPLRLYKDFSFSAAHTVESLPPEHKCRRNHGHTYHVRVWLEGKIHMPTGMCEGIELDTIKDAWKRIEEKLDHRSLNDTIGGNATVEHLAIYIYAQMKFTIPFVIGVEVSEGDSCGASFFDVAATQ